MVVIDFDDPEWASAWGGADLDPAAFDPVSFTDNLRSLHLTRFDG